MRITTNAVLRNYRYGLSNSISNLESARMQVLTDGRKYQRVSEDPASASRASQLHRKYYKNQDYISMVGDLQSRLDSQESAMMQISSMTKNISKQYNLEALNGTNGKEERATYATSLREFQKSMVLSLNSSYEDDFIFAGSDGATPPFQLSDDGLTLTYRGIDVNDAVAIEAAGFHKDPVYVDLGFGLTIDNNKNVVSSSAFNTSLPGINVVGYGQEDGLSNNLVVLAGQMASALEDENFNSELVAKISKRFDSSNDSLLNQTAQIGTKSKFLADTKERLKDNDLALISQLQSVEKVDLSEAITNYSWAQYAYNAALRVGNSILSPSFIDFMR